LQALTGARLLWLRTHADSHRCYYNPQQLVTLRFFRLHPKAQRLELRILGALNSTVYALIKEVNGRRGLGGGALETGLVDIMPFLLPKLEGPDGEALEESIKPIMKRSVSDLPHEIERPDRRSLDGAVIQLIGLSPKVIDDMYEETVHMIRTRTSKAASV
jgi:hypothetical protein